MPERKKKEECAARNKKKIKVYVAHVSQAEAGADTWGSRVFGGELGRLADRPGA